jgi:hypothetical protein
MPPPTANPTAATAQMLAAVVSPLTTSLRRMIVPAPMNQPYAAGHLRGYAGRIEDHVLLIEDVREPEDRDYHEQRGA